jgi:hypothetical protein
MNEYENRQTTRLHRFIPPLKVATVDDCPTKTDLLGFGKYVDSFAKIIASRDTKLPLSIGLFGNWGLRMTFYK